MSILFSLLMISAMKYPDGEPSVQQLRTMYYEASKSSSAANKFYDSIKDADDASPLQLGYRAMAEFMKCYHSFNPVTKLNYFAKGKSTLEHAIALAPESIELHYLRFTVQTNIPFFLSYSSSVNADKAFLLKNYPTLKDDELKSLIRDYMLNCDDCTEAEKKPFQK